MCPANASAIDDLYKMRHSLAHVLAQAVTKLWPATKISIGPPIDTGCYYDFLFSEPISDEDFKKIEKEMRSIINQGQTFAVDQLSVDDAIRFWKERGQQFKAELIEDLKKAGETKVTNYRNVNAKGEETFVDLCKGGHVENLKEIPADGFKIMSLAGAYFRGDEKRDQLTRVYLAAFLSKDELKAYLQMLEEAQKRDHRVLGQKLDLFVFSDRVGPGLPMLLPNGEIVKHLLESYMRAEKEKLGYSFVNIPHIAKRELYEKSGHMGMYDAMMPVMQDPEGEEYVLKAMNCPHHFELFISRRHSYRDLPLRYAENTTCYRNEKSGELSGLTRVKALTQDDTHHFVRHDQIRSEIEMILGLMERTYSTFGFNDFKVDISIRDPNYEKKYFGDNTLWDKAEKTLIEAVKKWGADYSIEEGEAAFYGPKIDIQVKDAIGRPWQLTTVQLDFVQPENFDMTYTGEDGKDHRPAVLHVAILGSSHRFMAVVIEHFAGLFPLWLAPVQVGMLPVAEAHEEYALRIQSQLREQGMRTLYLDAGESLNKRIREGEKKKIPYLLVLGDDEVKSGSVAVRNVKTKKQEIVFLAGFVDTTKKDVSERRLEASIGR
jgi:threonyl-tRNA synthetase